MRANILYVNDIRGAQALLPAALLSRRPLALSLRDTKPTEKRYGAPWHIVGQRLDAMVMLSDEMREREGNRLPVPSSRLYTINSIVDLDTFCPIEPAQRIALRARLGIGTNEHAIGMIAGVFDKKQQLQVISELLPKLVDLSIRLHVVGDFQPAANPYARACADMVAAQGLEDRVIFHGFRSNVADWLAAVDIVLVASRSEGLARCMIEAMACATPVVSFDVCSAREMLQLTGAGYVVGRDDWMGLAAAVRDLITDPDRRVAMGRAGRREALARFSTQRVAEDWNNLYMRLNGAEAGIKNCG
jgi:glycosyltransferase involved in cell wall biosynthesis